MAPKFSVIIPCLNEEKFVPKLLASLAEQTNQNFEVIVVDGMSSDKTVATAKSYMHKLPHLRVIVSSKASLPLQRNLGAKEAKSQWLVFVDADSVLLQHFFEKILFFIAQEKPMFFTAWGRPDSESDADALLTLLANMMIEGALFLKRPLSPGPLTIIRRNVFERFGGYDEGRTFQEDVDLSLRITSAGIPFRILRETVYVFSLRRLRGQGTAKVIRQYIIASLPVLFFRRTLKDMPGYIMGGQLYDKKQKPIQQSTLRIYEEKLKALVKELFE